MPSPKLHQALKHETGHEITEIDPSSFSDLCTYLWCCVMSASKREGKSFDMPLLDFADCLSPDDMETWSQAISADSGGDAAESDGKKKKNSRRI